jgi:hypothetical protein
MNKEDKVRFKRYIKSIYIDIALPLNNLKQRYLIDYDMLNAFTLIDKTYVIEPETLDVIQSSRSTILLRHLPNLYMMFMLNTDIKTIDNYAELLVNIDKDYELSMLSVGTRPSYVKP